MSKGAATYSLNCKSVKAKAKPKVQAKPFIASSLELQIRQWWVQVKVIPERINIPVFNNGIP